MRSGPSVGLPSACTRMSTTCISKALEHAESDGRELLRHIKYNIKKNKSTRTRGI